METVLILIGFVYGVLAAIAITLTLLSKLAHDTLRALRQERVRLEAEVAQMPPNTVAA